jgi:hypothetical protein
VVIERETQEPLWDGVARDAWASKSRFVVRPPDYVTPALAAFVDARLAAREAAG